MDREAVTAPVAMSIALALFVGFFAAVALTSDRVGADGAAEASDSALMRAQASSLLDLMLQSPGYSHTGDPESTVDWLGNTDTLVRLGLREAQGSSLSFNKFENLRRAPYEATADPYVNYEEARAALGFDDLGLGFHIRAKPSLRSVQDVLANGLKDENMRVTYIAATGASTGSSKELVTNLQCVADGHQIKVSLDLHNLGTQTAQLSAFVTLTSKEDASLDQSSRSEWINGPELAAGSSAHLSSSFPFYDDPDSTDLCGAGATLTATVWDSTQALKTKTVTLAGAAVAGHAHGLSLDSGTTYVLPGQDATFAYTGEELSDTETVTFTLVGPLEGTPGTWSDSFQAGKANKRSIVVGDNPSAPNSHAINTGSLVAGTYTATLEDSQSTPGVVTETLYVLPAAPGDYAEAGLGSGETLSTGAVAEITNLHDLVQKFCPFRHNDATNDEIVPPNPPETDYGVRCAFGPRDHGDVILDTKKNMDDDLPTRLLDGAGVATTEHVSTLVVGSNVNHQSMTSASAKHAVRDWVLAGGTLIVFGSNEQAVQWLQPIFHSGIESSSGGIGTPDADHPLLHVSDTLDYSSYSNHGRVWDLKENGGQSSADKFTNVVVAGSEPTLAISDPGAYGDGTVILTTWMPYDLFGDGSDPGAEGPKLINNLLTQSYRGLFLDYGPPLPEGQSVVPATGKAQILHPELGRKVSLDITLFVFRQA